MKWWLSVQRKGKIMGQRTEKINREPPRIRMPRGDVRKLTDEFGVSRQTVMDALSFRINSPKCMDIRVRAIELLEEEVRKVRSYLRKMNTSAM